MASSKGERFHWTSLNFIKKVDNSANLIATNVELSTLQSKTKTVTIIVPLPVHFMSVFDVTSKSVCLALRLAMAYSP